MGKTKFLITLILALLFMRPLSVSSAQEGARFKVGLLLFDPVTFVSEMTALGYIEGENIEYMTLSLADVAPEQVAEQYQIQVQAMIDAPVDVLVVTNDTDAVNLRQLTDIPVVFSISDDPVFTGAVEDLITPGGKSTGIVSNQHHTRRLQLLKDINPDTARVYYLYYSAALEGEAILNQVSTLGEELGIEVIGAPVADVETGVEMLEATPADADWIFLTPFLPFDPAFDEALINASVTHQIPVAGYLAIPLPGYVINYGPDLGAIVQQAAQITDQILRGADPAEIPVITAENELIVNLVVAEQMGLEVPLPILRQANSIIRPGDLNPTPVPTAGS